MKNQLGEVDNVYGIIIDMFTAQEIGSRCAPLFRRYGVAHASVFGSVARGEAMPGSDIDLVVSLKNPIGLFKFYELNDALEETLGHKVDLATPRSLNPHLALRIANDLTPIYEE
jgi:predicted nucleotidyltransferase